MSQASPPEPLRQLYEAACATPSDINEHLPVLYAIARRCDHVTEFGVRGAVSTTALLAAQPKKLVSYDIDPAAIVNNTIATLLNAAGSWTKFEPRVGSSIEVTIEETDMLFIDSLHTYKQLAAELTLHHSRVRKFIVLHDTETFGEEGEDETAPGLLQAVRMFRRIWAWPWWLAVVRRYNNNGLVVLQRAHPDAKHPAHGEPIFTWDDGRSTKEESK